MTKLMSFEIMKNPLSIPWIYENYTEVPKDVILETVQSVLKDEPRVFYLSENVVKNVRDVFLKPDENDPDSGEWINPYENESDVLFNMPFEATLLEGGSDGLVRLSTNCPLIKSERDWKNPQHFGMGLVDHQFGAIAFRELSPGSYAGFGIVMGIVEREADKHWFENRRFNGRKLLWKDRLFLAAMPLIEMSADEPPFLVDECRLFVRAFFDKLKTTYAVGKEHSTQRLRVGEGSSRRLTRIKNILHVAMKKERAAYQVATGKRINWTHRWEVMGHWRAVKTVGRDRAGNYTMKGFTWVTPHTKGPKNKQLIRKVRVVHDDRAHV